MPAAPLIIDAPAQLVTVLRERGWRVVAQTERDGMLDFAEIESAGELPRGRVDSQGPGRWRLVDGEPGRWFDAVPGPHGPKRWLFPPRRRLWSAAATEEGGLAFDETPDPFPRTAFFGVRACEIAAMEIQARVFSAGPASDPDHARRRANVLVVAVHCARAAPTCFCAAQGTGPRAETGFDLALTELDGGLLVETGSDAGERLAAALEARPATTEDLAAARKVSAAAAASQTRRLPADVAEALPARAAHPRWNDVAERCLACGSCTAVCPTCFCSDVEDRADPDGGRAERSRVWDGCFALDFSAVASGPVRASTSARYRQWLTHKLAHWHDQFGTSGCVGCGRCIAWCPAGIDLTREAAALCTLEAAP